MSVDTQPETAAPTLKGPRRRIRFTLIIVSLAALVLTATSLLFVPSPPDEPLVWLKPDTLLQPKVTNLMRVKYALMRLTAPLWSHSLKSHAQISITAKLLTVSNAVPVVTDLGEPVATNAEGMRAWILSPAKVPNFEKRLQARVGASVISSPRVSVSDGTPAQMFVGQTAAAPGSIPIGTSTYVLTSLKDTSLKLKLAVVSTEAEGSTNGSLPLVRTNLAVACQALIPNAGGLAVDTAQAKHPGQSNIWLIVVPRAVDAKGNLLKL